MVQQKKSKMLNIQSDTEMGNKYKVIGISDQVITSDLT